jgi:hypothetical protein
MKAEPPLLFVSESLMKKATGWISSPPVASFFFEEAHSSGAANDDPNNADYYYGYTYSDRGEHHATAAGLHHDVHFTVEAAQMQDISPIKNRNTRP